MRQCPTPEGGPAARPLIAHRISACECVQRRNEHYHKCHGCVFGGKAVDLSLGDRNGAVTPRNGVAPMKRAVEPAVERVVERVVELPSRNGRPAPVVATPFQPVKG